MKYIAKQNQENPEEWFIKTGTRKGKDIGKRNMTELEAKQKAALWNMQESQRLVDKYWNELYEMSEHSEFNPDEIRLVNDPEDCWTSQGDFLC